MKAGKITAKLRDAVQVCLLVEGKEVKRYKNIELPDALKELEMKDFAFHTTLDDKITFHIHFEPGILPEVFPEPRPTNTRKSKNETPTIIPTEETPDVEESKPEDMEPEASEEPGIDTETMEEPCDMEIAYNVTGSERKALAAAVSAILNAVTEYKAAPTFAYEIGDYTIDKNGTLTGKENKALTDALAEQGFVAEE